MDRYSALPLSSLVRNFASHPLAGPVHPRLAFLESRLLLSTPAAVLKRLGFSPPAISTLALALACALAARWRAQWRLLLAALGVAEATARSFALLDALDRDKDRDRKLKQETKHVVSFWLLYALVHTAETARAIDPSPHATAPARYRVYLRTLLSHLRPLLLRFLPTRPPHPTAFPQPTPFLPSSALSGRSTANFLDPSTPTYAIVKLLLLWTALRRDGTGASALWDWLVSPVLAVRKARGGGRRKRVVVIEDYASATSTASEAEASDVEEEGDHVLSPPRAGQRRPTPPSAQQVSPSPSPSPSSSSSSSSETLPTTPLLPGSNAFPTPPHVAYRLTSLSHPIHAHGSREEDFSKVPGDTPSPSPARDVLGFGRRVVGGGLGLGGLGFEGDASGGGQGQWMEGGRTHWGEGE